MDTDLDHVGGCMSNYSKFIKLLLSFVIAVSPILLINNANAAIGGWNLTNPVAQGASTLYDASKNVLINGKNVVKKSSALITPAATGVAKVLARGAAGYALSVVVEQLIGSVDWVLDPANNRIIYYETNTDSHCSGPYFAAGGFSRGTSASAICNTAKKRLGYESVSTGPLDENCNATCTFNNGDTLTAIGVVVGEVEKEEKYLPLDVVAQKVISNANAGDAAAQQATTAAAADIVAEVEKDDAKARPIVNQLEANAETATDETATGESVPKDPTAPDATKPTNISLEFPKFCGWAPSVCEAAQVVISFPTLVTEWWETANTKADGWATSISQSWAAAKEWATSEPSQDNTQVDVENNNTQEIDTQVSFSTQCPANIKLADFSYHGISQSWDVDFSKFCDVFATYLRPVVISIGAFSAVLIVSGVGVRENG